MFLPTILIYKLVSQLFSNWSANQLTIAV